MSIKNDEKLQQGQDPQGQSDVPVVTEGLIELGTVSDTRGGLVGWLQDIGNGWQFGI